jgi:glycerol uptake facilitator protein
MRSRRLGRECLAEFAGTFLLVFFGAGAVFVSVLTGALQGPFQVAIIWGLVVALSIYAVGAISGAHINPAVTFAAALFRGFPPIKILPFIVSQLAGAMCASVVLLALFGNILSDFEAAKGLIRGQPGSELSAMVFGEYFPNPALFGTTAEAYAKVSVSQAMAAEGFGTALLVFFIFALTDPRNRSRPDGTFSALFIGLTITLLIAVIAPLTQAGFNPARDFGPRLVALAAGWGSVAIPGPRGGCVLVYVLAPLVGGCVGGVLYDVAFRAPASKSLPAGSEAAARAGT